MANHKNILRYVSDLHLELLDNINNDMLQSLWNFKKNSNDKYYLALLGDIGNPFPQNLQKFLEMVSSIYNVRLRLPFR